MSRTPPHTTSFTNLEVYQHTYRASLIVMTRLVPLLPESEQHDLKSQLSRSCKAVPRLIAEGYAKRHQTRGFQKYLDDAIGECNEMLVSVTHCRDLYGSRFAPELCDGLIDGYDKAARQLYNLAVSWSNFQPRRRKPMPPDEAHLETARRNEPAQVS